jgi:hypothetical protein
VLRTETGRVLVECIRRIDVRILDGRIEAEGILSQLLFLPISLFLIF